MEENQRYLQNHSLVQRQIQSKLSTNRPYFPPAKDIYQVFSSIDAWPYPKTFQGSPSSSVPKVWDRQAGYQKILPTPSHAVLSNLCFQPACNTQFPCQDNKNFLPLPQKCIFESP